MGTNQSSSTGVMKAVVRANNALGLNAEWPIPPEPKPNSDRVIIRVRAAGINPIDYKLPTKLPKFAVGALVGSDVAGVIEKIAPGNVTHDFKVGDEVYGKANGSLVEFAVASASTLARKPKELSFVEAAAMNVTYMTGWQALTTYGGLKEGGRVLIIGASGGTGTAGVQIAKALKASAIVAVCSGKNEELVRNLGATHVVDYKKTKFVDVYGEAKDEEKFDVVYDCASFSGGGENYVEDSRRVLKVGPPAGQYVPINGSKTMWARSTFSIQPANTHLFICKTTTEGLDNISKLVVEEGLRPVIAETEAFTKAGVDSAFSKLKSRRTVGKIVIDMEKEIEEVKTQEVPQEKKTENVEDAPKAVPAAEVEVVGDAQDKPVEQDVPEAKEKTTEEDNDGKTEDPPVKAVPDQEEKGGGQAVPDAQEKPSKDDKQSETANAQVEAVADEKDKPSEQAVPDVQEEPPVEDSKPQTDDIKVEDVPGEKEKPSDIAVPEAIETPAVEESKPQTEEAKVEAVSEEKEKPSEIAVPGTQETPVVDDSKPQIEEAKVEAVTDEKEKPSEEAVPESKEKPSEETEVETEKPKPAAESQVEEEKSKPVEDAPVKVEA